MDTIDLMSWVLVGVIAGSLAGALQPGISTRAWLVVLGMGLLDACGGGWILHALGGTSAVAFLGAVCAAVLGTVPLSYLLRRRGVTRYRTS